jgi:acetylornithine deacetylase/succinyl-diaminopimelate desuccinylase-like protein
MDAELFLASACELLAIPSAGEQPGEHRRALDYVLDFVGPGFTVERLESGGKPSALVYPGRERREFRVILDAHLDVVPAPPAQFRPYRDGDRLFARGAQDMKLSGLLAAQAFREQAARLPYPVALQLVTDEEAGGRVTLARVRTQNQARNQVPADAEGLLDIRFPAADTDLAGRTSAEVTAYLQGFLRAGVTPVVDILDPPHRADSDQPEVRRLRDAARRQGYTGGLLRQHGVSDGRCYGQLGIPAVAFGVGGSGQHGPDEYADLTTVAPYYRALCDFLGAADGPG